MTILCPCRTCLVRGTCDKSDERCLAKFKENLLMFPIFTFIALITGAGLLLGNTVCFIYGGYSSIYVVFVSLIFFFVASLLALCIIIMKVTSKGVPIKEDQDDEEY